MRSSALASVLAKISLASLILDSIFSLSSGLTLSAKSLRVFSPEKIAESGAGKFAFDEKQIIVAHEF